MDVVAAKSALRNRIKLALKTLNSSNRYAQSLEVTRMLLANPQYQKSKNVAVFLSMNDEIDTTDIVRNIFDCGKRCYVPRYSDSNGYMTMIKIQSFNQIDALPRTKWNIPQPLESDSGEDCMNLGGLDLLLIPGLAFTRAGCRLGRGKGFYDKFIKTYSSLHKPPYLIGLALDLSIVDNIPCNEDDVEMDEVIYTSNEK